MSVSEPPGFEDNLNELKERCEEKEMFLIATNLDNYKLKY